LPSVAPIHASFFSLTACFRQGPLRRRHPPRCRPPHRVRHPLFSSATRSSSSDSPPSAISSRASQNERSTPLPRLSFPRYPIPHYSAHRRITPFLKYSHASRYMELYLPTGSIEIAHTQRYSHRTGKSELCILATRTLAPGTVLSELKGSMADLSEADELELKRTDRRNSHGGIRRDFSVIHSKQLKKNHLFLGPARFVNVSEVSCPRFPTCTSPIRIHALLTRSPTFPLPLTSPFYLFLSE
jgi:hypothetical protein